MLSLHTRLPTHPVWLILPGESRLKTVKWWDTQTCFQLAACVTVFICNDVRRPVFKNIRRVDYFQICSQRSRWAQALVQWDSFEKLAPPSSDTQPEMLQTELNWTDWSSVGHQWLLWLVSWSQALGTIDILLSCGVDHALYVYPLHCCLKSFLYWIKKSFLNFAYSSTYFSLSAHVLFPAARNQVGPLSFTRWSQTVMLGTVSHEQQSFVWCCIISRAKDKLPLVFSTKTYYSL